MTVVGEHHDRAAPAVEHPALIDVRRVHEVLLRSPGPVHRQAHAAVLVGLAVVIDVPFGVVEVEDSLAAPEVDREGLQAGQIVAEIRDRRVLAVADVMVLDDSAFEIGEEEALVACRV